MRKIIFAVLFFVSSLYASEVSMLDNGAKFVEIPREYTETISIVMFVKGGLFRETVHNNGIGNLFSSVWVKSSKLLDKIEFYGGSIGASITNDYLELSVSVPYDNFKYIIDDLKEFIAAPKFDKNIFMVQKKLVLSAIESIKDNPNSLAMKGFNKLAYKDFVYAMDSIGTKESVEKIEFDDLKAYYEKNINGADAVISIAGKFTDKDIEQLRKIFSLIPKGEKIKIDCSGSQIDEDRFLEETDDKIKQAKLFLGIDAPGASQSEYIPLKVLSDLMGGGMSSMYFEKLRKEKGYAYSVGSFYPSRICNARWVAYIGLDYSNVDDSLKTMKGLLNTIEKDVDDKRIENVKNYVIGRILIESQTNSKIAWYSSFFETLGLGYDFMDKYIDLLKHVDKKEILMAAEMLLKNKSAIYVLKPEEKQ